MLRLAYFEIDLKGNPELPFKSKICAQTIFKGGNNHLLYYPDYQFIALNGKKVFILHKIMKQVFLKNGPQKGGRPTNEYRLTGTPLPEMARG